MVSPEAAGVLDLVKFDSASPWLETVFEYRGGSGAPRQAGRPPVSARPGPRFLDAASDVL